MPSTSAARAHAYVGPHKQRRAPYAFGLPPGPTLTIWENPEDIPHAFWSPFESKAFMAHQIHLMQRNLRQEIQVVTDFDRWRASIGTFTLAPLLSLMFIGMGGVMLGSTEWAGGLRDRALPVTAEQRRAVDPLLEATIQTITDTFSRLSGLGPRSPADGSAASGRTGRFSGTCDQPQT